MCEMVHKCSEILVVSTLPFISYFYINIYLVALDVSYDVWAQESRHAGSCPGARGNLSSPARD